MKRSKNFLEKEVKKTKNNFYLSILSSLNQGIRPNNKDKKKPSISKKLNISKQRLQYYLGILKQKGYIIKRGYGTWELTKEGKLILGKLATSKNLTLGTIEDFKANLHALNINIAIKSGNLNLIKDFEGYFQRKLRGWHPQYAKILSPIGYTIKNNNNKSIDIFIWAREIPRDHNITNLIMQTIMHINQLLAQKKVFIDIFSPKVKRLHISVKNKDLDNVIASGETFEVLLGRKGAKILPSDESTEAKAWADNSPYLGIETNDIQYKENLILMPERVAYLKEWSGNINAYNENLELHLEVQRENLKTLKAIQRTLKRIER